MRLTILMGIAITCSLAVGLLHAAAIHDAIREENVAAVTAALPQKEEIENNVTPLFLAVDMGNPVIVTLLLDNKVNVNAAMDASEDYPGWTALHLAASRDNAIYRRLVIESGGAKRYPHGTRRASSSVGILSGAAIKTKLE